MFCGGGSGGHVMPAITIINKLNIGLNCSIIYVGSKNGIEKKLVSRIKGVKYIGIRVGKLRRYFSFKNVIDLINVVYGILECLYLFIKTSNQKKIIFSTGGFVSVPVVVAAFITRNKIYIHEQTSRLGLANKIGSKLANKILISFEGSRKFLPEEKVIYSGYPVRDECFLPKKISLTVSSTAIHEIERPILLVTAGGNGSNLLNELVIENLAWLKDQYYIIHQVGAKSLVDYLKYNDENYMALSFIENIIELFKYADVVISRSGAGTVCELTAMGKKSIFIPLKIAQKNEQFYNAMEAKEKLGSLVVTEDDLKMASLQELIKELEQVDIKSNEKKMSENSLDMIIEFIKKELSKI